MSNKIKEQGSSGHTSSISKKAYKDTLRKLQIELVKLQRHFIKCDDKILIILEGRDASGKDGTIKRIVEHLSPRETRIVALGKPSDRDRVSWYFQRYVPHLPAAQELVLFNRSWYNRAGVERVMHFCTESEYQEFMGSVSDFEHMLVRSRIKLLKYYLDISKPEQKQRLNARKSDPLTQWKVSTLDNLALKKWKQYSAGARRNADTYPQPHSAVDHRARRRQASGAAQHHQGYAQSASLCRQGRAADPAGPADRIRIRYLKSRKRPACEVI